MKAQELAKMQILITNFLRNSQNRVIYIPFYCFFWNCFKRLYKSI